jgi:monoamine oxidase
MNRLSRRAFLAGTAAAATTPALGAVPASSDVDVVIVGAGAAGIAAARRLMTLGRRVAIVEATDHVGGRCVTDRTTFGVPFDRGAHWIHMPDINPVAKLARGTGLEVYPAPSGQKLRVGRRSAREGELEDYLSWSVRTSRAISEAGRGARDVSAAQALPKDLVDWRPTIEFVLGPFGCGKDLDQVSAADFGRSAERDVDSFCRQGLGTLLAKLADEVPVRFAAPVTKINAWGRGTVSMETAKGTMNGRAVIVTVSTDVLTSGKIKFDPPLPKRHLDAAAKLTLGSYDHVALELTERLALENDELVFEKASGPRTAGLLANIGGMPLCTVEVAGKFGRSLANEGDRAMVAFATDWMANLFGNDVKKSVKRAHATQWAKEPWVLGAFSCASPGGQPGRKILMEPFRDRVWFAGEAVHETLWGTVGGAWESGERAADAAHKQLSRGGGRAAPRPGGRGRSPVTSDRVPSTDFRDRQSN